MLDKFKLSPSSLAKLYLPIHKAYYKFEPDIFIDYHENANRFVFGYDSNEAIPTELAAIIFREKIIRILADSGFPPHIEKNGTDWIIMFTNYDIMKQTVFSDSTIDHALTDACKYLLKHELIKE